jgi:cytochrome c-type biogenesis protein
VEALLLAFFGGIGGTITPCVLPLYPGFLAYVTGNQPVAGGRALAPVLAAAVVWFGVVAGMVAIGAVLALAGAPLGDFNRVALPLADGLLIALGVLLLAGVNPFARLP